MHLWEFEQKSLVKTNFEGHPSISYLNVTALKFVIVIIAQLALNYRYLELLCNDEKCSESHAKRFHLFWPKYPTGVRYFCPAKNGQAFRVIAHTKCKCIHDNWRLVIVMGGSRSHWSFSAWGETFGLEGARFKVDDLTVTLDFGNFVLLRGCGTCCISF